MAVQQSGTTPGVGSAGFIVGVLCGVFGVMAWQWAFSESRSKPLVHQCVEWRMMGEPQIIATGERRCERWSDGKTRADVFK